MSSHPPVRLVAALWWFAGALLALNLAAAIAGDLTVLSLWRDLVRLRLGEDSWAVMLHALDVAASGDGDLYATVFFDERLKLQYPPPALLLPAAVASLCGACDARTIGRLLTGLGFISSLLVPAVVVALVRRGRGVPNRERWPAATAAALACALSYPLLLAVVLGQVQAVLNGLYAVAFWCVFTGRRAGAGAIVGLMALVKPHYGALAVWALVRRDLRFAGAAAVTAGAGLAISTAVFGLASHTGFLDVAAYIAARGESLYANQSINGLLNRALLPQDALGWSPHAFPPPHALVQAGTLAAAAVLFALALIVPARRGLAGSWLDFAIASLTVTVASTLAWEHYYAIVLPIEAALLAHRGPWRPRPALLLAAAAILTGTMIGPLARLDAQPWNVLQSYVLGGALLLLVLLYVAAAGRPNTDGEERRA